MVNCPTCGRPVPEGQRFCGNCGTDVQAALAYRTPPAPPISPALPIGLNQGTDFFDATPVTRGRPNTIVILGLTIAIALLCLCCGLIVGALGMYWLGPVPTPVPAPVQTPAASELYSALASLV